jgi:hypothetical protein
MAGFSQAELEQRIEEIKELMRIWMRFYRILSAGPENMTPEREKEFNQIKTVVAQRHKHFMEVIEKDDDKYIGQNILNMVKRVISLKEFAKLSRLEISKISIEWHDANILLNEILGILEYKLDQVKRGIKVDVPGQESEEEEEEKGGKKSKLKSVAGVLIVAVAAVLIFVFREEIQAHPFYQKYLADYVNVVVDIFK